MGKKKFQNILTQRNKTHHDIFSFALNSEFGGLFSWCGCCHGLLTFLTWLDPCSAVFFRLPLLDHLKVFRFIQQNISACQLWRAGACRRYIFPLQVALAANFSLGWALVPKKPSVVWAPATFEWSSFPVYCFIWITALSAACEWERSLLCYFFTLWLANYFLLKLGHPISFFLAGAIYLPLSFPRCWYQCHFASDGVPWVLEVPAICLLFDYSPSTVQNRFALLLLSILIT